jgi:arginine:pyruvate transaminase
MQGSDERGKTKGQSMRFSPLVDRIAGEGAAAWSIHNAAREAQQRGEDVIVLSIGDPIMETPSAVLERAIESLRAGDIRYTPAAGRVGLRAAIAQAHSLRTGQAVSADNVIFLSGTQNALYTASLCVAGAGDEVLALEPLYPSYRSGDNAAHSRAVLRHAEQSQRRYFERSGHDRHRRTRPPAFIVGGGR